MKLLHDEHLPVAIKNDLSEYEVFTVDDKNWNGIKNGALLRLMVSEGFDVLITMDKNLEYQQNFQKHPIAVFCLEAKSNSYAILHPLIPELKRRLRQTLKPGVTTISFPT